MKKILLYAVGGICLILGSIGIFIPILPTTPFVLIAAACFACNKKIYDKLTNSKVFGAYIRHYRYKVGVPLITKIISLVFLWAMLTVSIIFVQLLWVRILLGCIGIAVSLHICLIKTKHNSPK